MYLFSHKMLKLYSWSTVQILPSQYQLPQPLKSSCGSLCQGHSKGLQNTRHFGRLCWGALCDFFITKN